MSLSVTVIAIICVASAAALGFGIVLALFVLTFFGYLRISNGGVADGSRYWSRQRNAHEQLGLPSSGEAAAVEAQWKGIPLNSRPPRLTPEQEILRDKAMEKYKRRLARQERRSQRQAAPEARRGNVRGGTREGTVSEDEFADDSSDTSLTTLTSKATTVRTTSTVAYGRSCYVQPPSGDCMVHIGEHDDNEDRQSSYSSGSRSSRGSGRSRTSQRSIATIKSYLRHRQRQRLRRREEQQQLELFNQWAYAQMVSSSDLSSSSKSVSAASQHDEGGSTTGEGASPWARKVRERYGCNHVHQGRTSSISNPAPRSMEDVVAADCASYPLPMNDEHRNLESLKVDNEFSSPNQIAFNANTSRCDTTGSTAPQVVSVEHVEYAGHGVFGVHTGAHVEHGPPRRHQRRWKDVEQNIALSGFFNTTASNTMAGVDAPSQSHHRDGRVPAPSLTDPAKPTHGSLLSHEPICHESV
ncbi:transcription like protein nupm1, putative [Leishmania tarentolae]|uniref:Transcription like protein nupm1, putative n=1 Tax=Leishmania tarentolae TaxID=5689 RepID=A0A640KUM2_LEITA|nr:transcription like protein nupm1, putative [Leishmania tarentolae]